jgi:hypothetical protein
MENFLNYVSESLKKLGKLKLPPDPANSHRFKERGANRKSLKQVPDKYRVDKTDMSAGGLAAMIKGLDTSGRMVDIAKKAPSGVWRISKREVLDIARKYKFIVPNENKPMKHLGSTGIQMVRYKPGMFYLFKPHKKRGKHRKKRNPFGGKGHSKMIKGIIGK